MDEEDKIRRNLVLFCAGVIGVAWFGVPVQQIASDLLKIQAFSTAKAWLAALIVLMYLVLRYHFSKDAKLLGTQVRQHMDREYWARIAPLVVHDVRESYRTGLANETVGRELQPFLSQMKTNLAASLSPEQVEQLDVNVTLDRGKSVWEGTAGLNVGNGTGQFNVYYAVPRGKRVKVRVSGFFLSWIYSDTGINLVFPYVIAIPAVAVIVWKLLEGLLA